MKNSIVTNTRSLGDMKNFSDKVRNRYTLDIYQGDTSDLQPHDVVPFAAGAWLPTGSICHIEDGKAVAGPGTDAAGKCYTPYIVKVGTDKLSVTSEKYNAAGGLVTLLPLSEGYRLVTSVYDKDAGTYATGDLLTVGSFTFDGHTVYGVKKATTVTASTLIVGVCDGPVGVDVKRNNAVKFTACYKVNPVIG